MGITFHRVRILQPPTNTTRACNGGIFNLDVEVHGTTDGAGGRYRVELWDDDPLFDDLLETSVVVPVAPNQNFTIVTPMTLTCNEDCEVAGPLDTSGESVAEIYPYAREQVPLGAAVLGGAAINLICDDDCKDFGDERREDPEQQIIVKEGKLA